MEYYGVDYLRAKLKEKRPGVLKRYKYYDAKNIVRDLGISTPPNLMYWVSALGWCGRGVDALADRLVFKGFRNDDFDVNGIFDMNNPDIFTSSGIKGALISSCDFVYISNGADEFPRLQVIDGGNATGVINPITALLNEGYAVLERDKYDNPILEAYFTFEDTQIFEGGKLVQTIPNDTPAPLLVPLIYQADAKNPFGRSRITPACMSLQDGAIRTVKRSEIAAEFYSYPQKYVTGLSEDAEISDKWKATMSAMITFTNDENGNHPVVGQFQQEAMTPHTEQLKMFASLFAGEMGLTMDDMGFPTSNPSSAESIKAAHESLKLSARAAQRGFNSGLLNVGYLAACLRDKRAYKREQFYLTTTRWAPIFEMDVTNLGSLGDAIYKLNEAVPGLITTELLEDLTGFDLG